MKRAISTTVMLALCAGCATTSPETRSAGEGAAIGVGAGFLLCKLAGGSNDTCAAVAAIGGAAGATIGYSYAKNIETRRKQLEGHENDLDARIRYARGVNQDSEVLNKQIKARFDSRQTETTKLVEQIERGQISQQQREQERKKLDGEVKAVSEQVAKMEGELNDLKQFRAKSSKLDAEKARALDAEIAHLERMVADARGNTTAMASLSQRF